jgi:pyrroloquinoline quinone biosynthesis protein B
VGSDNRSWFLLNASPDLRLQIEAAPFLYPRAPRHSPIEGVLLTSGDIDQIAGLLSLRELQPFRIWCTASLRQILQKDNSVFAMLNRVPNQASWNEITAVENFSLLTMAGKDSGITCEVFSLGQRLPPYVSAKRAAKFKTAEALLGVVLESSTGKRLAYLPAVPKIDGKLLRRLEGVDPLLFDGTFWSEDELIQVQGSGATAREMGHVPVSESLKKLSGVRGRKVFIHINNTNPMLDESSPQYREVRDAGWEMAEDGWRFDL